MALDGVDLEFSKLILAVVVAGSMIGGESFLVLMPSGVGGEDVGTASSCSLWVPLAAQVGCICWSGVVSGSDLSAVLSPSTSLAEGRLPPPSLLASQGWLKGVLNLLRQRPLCFVLLGSRCGEPSGLVPGVATVEQDEQHPACGGSGAGPDCVSGIRSRVQSAYCKDLVGIFPFFGVLLVICNTTAES